VVPGTLGFTAETQRRRGDGDGDRIQPTGAVCQESRAWAADLSPATRARIWGHSFPRLKAGGYFLWPANAGSHPRGLTETVPSWALPRESLS
jgi:hypothetical protein